eukprot:superscaffoldBa00003692_g17503
MHARQGCVLSPLLFTLLTCDFAPTYSSNHFVRFADDTTVVGLISNNDKSNYRNEVNQLVTSFNLFLNLGKTKEIVIDFRRTQHPPLTIDGTAVEQVSSIKFLGVYITNDLSWTINTASLAKKGQQHLYFLQKLSRARAPAPIMYFFCRGIIESIVTSCITVWFGSCTACLQSQDLTAHSERGWEDQRCLTLLPPEHLQHLPSL